MVLLKVPCTKRRTRAGRSLGRSAAGSAIRAQRAGSVSVIPTRPRRTFRSRNLIALPTATRAANLKTNALTLSRTKSPMIPRRAGRLFGASSAGSLMRNLTSRCAGAAGTPRLFGPVAPDVASLANSHEYTPSCSSKTTASSCGARVSASSVVLPAGADFAPRRRVARAAAGPGSSSTWSTNCIS